MASTAVRYPTPQRVDGSTQHTSVEVTDPLLCPPELDLVTRVSRPCICLCRGVLAPRRLASPQSLSCAIQHVYSLVPQRRRRLLLIYSLYSGSGVAPEGQGRGSFDGRGLERIAVEGGDRKDGGVKQRCVAVPWHARTILPSGQADARRRTTGLGRECVHDDEHERVEQRAHHRG